ncbi:hypothetical protein F4U94_14665 [Sphingobium limneticum]|uniref:hypothetical protein n=1 Tax=Sphingobium limneticum TaxID=1007511 RepID=UPI00123D58FE|nr:hypothetical protein [Sphingobium limneticum]KAA9014074.1 hypothetical protein F4U94_14665 [Sphingobium limneticum]
MALLSELVSICETHRLDTGATLNVFARRLREAGRVSKAGRGRGAAHMTYLDAARFLIACAATDHPERTADAEYAFSNITLSDDNQWCEAFHITAENAPTLDLALAKLLEGIATGEIDAIQQGKNEERRPGSALRIPPFFGLILRRSHVSASLRIMEGYYHFQHPTLAAIVAAPDYLAQKPLMEELERDTYRFRTGKNLVAELEEKLLRAVAHLIAGKGAGSIIGPEN